MSLINCATGRRYLPPIYQCQETPEELPAFDTDFDPAYIRLTAAGDVTVVGASSTSDTGKTITLDVGVHEIVVRRINATGTTLTESQILLCR